MEKEINMKYQIGKRNREEDYNRMMEDNKLKQVKITNIKWE